MTKLQFGVVCGFLVLIVVLLAAPILAPERTAPQWEYRIEDIHDVDLETTLDKHGGGGWELVFARRATEGKGTDSTPLYEVIFKRPR